MYVNFVDKWKSYNLKKEEVMFFLIKIFYVKLIFILIIYYVVSYEKFFCF